MKKRYIVFTALIFGSLLLGLMFYCFRAGVVKNNVRDFAAENYQGASETNYTQFAVYLGEDAFLTPDSIMGVKNELENAMVKASFEPQDKYLLCGSGEKDVILDREGIYLDAVATVYFGDYFGLHPQIPQSGGYVDESAASTDFCVIDDIAAWRLFGSVDVCGMELNVNEKSYVINAVIRAEREEYAEFYGDKPRIYIMYSSAAVRDEQVMFTSLEAVLPDLYDGFAKNMLSETVIGFSDEVQVITKRFSLLRLLDNLKEIIKLGVKNGEKYPYYENISCVMETKCALLLFFEGIFFLTAAVLFMVLVILVGYPISKKLKEKKLAKRRHAII